MELEFFLASRSYGEWFTSSRTTVFITLFETVSLLWLAVEPLDNERGGMSVESTRMGT